MPSVTVHLFVACEIAKRLNISNLGRFYLGAIAPDAVNLGGKADRDTRYSAHLRSTDYNEWVQNVIRYRKESEIKNTDTDFANGFAAHLFTDIAWDIKIQPRIFESLRSLGFTENELNAKKWDVLSAFDAKALQSDRWKNDILPYLKAADTANTEAVDSELLAKWRDHILSGDFVKEVKPDFAEIITETDINSTAQSVLDLFEKLN